MVHTFRYVYLKAHLRKRSHKGQRHLCSTLSSSAPVAPQARSKAAYCKHLSIAPRPISVSSLPRLTISSTSRARSIERLTADFICLIFNGLHDLRMSIPDTRNRSPTHCINHCLPILQGHIDPLRAHRNGWPPRGTVQDRGRTRGDERRFQVLSRRCSGAVPIGRGGEDFGGRGRSHSSRCGLRIRTKVGVKMSRICEANDIVIAPRVTESSRPISDEAFYPLPRSV